MLPKCFSLLQLHICFAFLKNYKISIFNAAMTIKTIVSVRQLLRNFLITFSKRSMFTFIIIKPITKFGFRFPNVGDFATNFTFSQIELFRNHIFFSRKWQRSEKVCFETTELYYSKYHIYRHKSYILYTFQLLFSWLYHGGTKEKETQL